MHNAEPLLLRVPDAARLASVGRTLAFELVARGEWPSVRLGRAVRVPVDGLRAWIARNTKGGPAANGDAGDASGEDSAR